MTLSGVDLEELLGTNAAEDEHPERLQTYFLDTPASREAKNADRKLRVIVGKKGTGKSAIFRIAAIEDRKAKRLPIEVRPDDLSNIAQGSSNYLQLVTAWKKGLAGVIVEKSLNALGNSDPRLISGAKKATGKVLDTIVKAIGDEHRGYRLDAAHADAASAFMRNRELTIYLDDLDRGWRGTQLDAQRYGAMFDAIRDLQRENPTLRARIGLRTDLYTLIRSTDSSSDKWQSSVIHHDWSNHETFVLLVKRVSTYFGHDLDYEELLRRPQQSSAHLLDTIIDRYFTGKGLWHRKPMYNVIMSFARRRPRDLVVLLNLASRQATERNHPVIRTDDLQDIFSRFSQERLVDASNEFGLEARGLDKFLVTMKPSKVERTAAANYLLPTSKMLTRIKRALDQAPLYFADRRQAQPMEVLAFLYRIDFLQARKDGPDGIDRRYFDQSHILTPDKVDVGYDWEIHLAFRWALQPDDPSDIFKFVPPDSTD